ncbi:hypothetical protein IAT40_007590 [Kwoniella sp. CBS 6097]
MSEQSRQTHTILRPRDSEATLVPQHDQATNNTEGPAPRPSTDSQRSGDKPPEQGTASGTRPAPSDTHATGNANHQGTAGDIEQVPSDTQATRNTNATRSSRRGRYFYRGGPGRSRR